MSFFQRHAADAPIIIFRCQRQQAISGRRRRAADDTSHVTALFSPSHHYGCRFSRSSAARYASAAAFCQIS